MRTYLFLLILIAFNAHAQVMTEDRFNGVIERLESVYAPIIAGHGATLEIEAKWSSGTQNAFARRYDDDAIWTIVIYGGLARLPGVTDDALMLVLCHELGHHLAGAPYKAKDEIVSWASAEGAADLFATSQCLKKIFATDDNAEIIKNLAPNEVINQKCLGDALCIRSILAAKSMMELVGFKGLSLENPDTTVVSSTNLNYPSGQCRLDTLIQGAVCDARSESCEKPLCWFHP